LQEISPFRFAPVEMTRGMFVSLEMAEILFFYLLNNLFRIFAKNLKTTLKSK